MRESTTKPLTRSEAYKAAQLPDTGTWGRVEKIDWTNGGLGNQFTTIDGVEYATWWDFKKHNVRVGVQVRFIPWRFEPNCGYPTSWQCATIAEMRG